MASVDQRLLDLLACPACHGHIHLEPAQQGEGDHIVCDACGRRYPVRDGIPIMLVEEAEDGPEPAQTPAEPQADA